MSKNEEIFSPRMISIFKGDSWVDHLVENFNIDTAKEIIEKELPELQVSIEYNDFLEEYSIFSNHTSEEILVLDTETFAILEIDNRLLHIYTPDSN